MKNRRSLAFLLQENERIRENYFYLFDQIQLEINDDDDPSLLTPPVIKSFISSVRP